MRPLTDKPQLGNNQELVASCQGLVRSLAWKVHRKLPRHVDLEDLVSYGQLGLVEAARDFDASRGSQFTTYAYHRIRGAIFDGLAKMNWFNQFDYHSGRYEKMAGEVLANEADEHAGEQSSLVEGAKWLGRVSNDLAVVYMLSNSASSDGEDRGEIEDHDAPQPASRMLRRELSEKLHETIDSLPADAAGLIRATYFEGLSLKEAGERLGISKSWASRLHARALEELARSLTLAEMAESSN
jgi:RNA polymerase sigma factor for flagellar operon FliA